MAKVVYLFIMEDISLSGFSDVSRAAHNIRLLKDSTLAAGIERIVALAMETPSPDDALNNLERIAPHMTEEYAKLLLEGEGMGVVLNMCASSNILPLYISRSPDCLRELFKDGSMFMRKGRNIFLREILEGIDDEEDIDSVEKGLRLYGRKECVRIGGRSLSGLAPMQETAEELADLASASLEVAYRSSRKVLEKEYGTPYCAGGEGRREAEFVVVGMGKLGGRELNFSSDIDIIYITSSSDGETSGGMVKRGKGIDLHTYFVKLAEMITGLLNNITEEGLVFRVDLDLRPEGKNGDIVNSIRSAEIYYESWGQTWERAAMIKARPVAGSTALGARFMKMIEPFVYRRYLDFTAIEEIKAMKEKIDLSLLRRPRDRIDVKLGVGGIREIEFFVQALQLIYGGKDISVREENTLSALERLMDRGYISRGDSDSLRESYVFLRDLEHRIQMIEGRQAHVIPPDKTDQRRIARAMNLVEGGGVTTVAGFWKAVRRHMERVHKIYGSLFYSPSRVDIEKEPPVEVLGLFSPEISRGEGVRAISSMGFEDPEDAWKRFQALKDGPPFAHLPSKARLLLDKLGPAIFLRILSSSNRDMALGYTEAFMAAIGAKYEFYALLAENSKVIELLVRIFSASAFLSRFLVEHPENIELLLSAELNRPVKTRDELYLELEDLLEGAEDYEARLNAMRRFRNNEVMRIGVNDIFGAIDPLTASSQLTCLADITLKHAYEIAMKDLSMLYGAPKEARFSIFGLGKLGGEELLYSSDLDIIFVCSASGGTGGAKMVSGPEFFAKLGQRIISILSMMTREGVVFKIDTRLRPSGSAGPLVVTGDSLLRYYRETAAVWERQAMIKARFVCGDHDFGHEVFRDLQSVIYSKRMTDSDMEELYRMRQRIETEIAKEGPSKYNVKTGKGGLVDVEFLTQTLQLIYGKDVPSIRKANTLMALEALNNAGYIADGDYEVLKRAYEFYRLIENRLRIVQDRPEGNLLLGSKELLNLAGQLGYRGPSRDMELVKDYADMAERVRRLYLKVIKECRTANSPGAGGDCDSS